MPQLTAHGSTTLTVQGKTFDYPKGANLRQVLLAHSIPVHTSTTLSVHNDQAALINCRGLGTFLFLAGATLLIAYLVFSALTEMGSKWPWRK